MGRKTRRRRGWSGVRVVVCWAVGGVVVVNVWMQGWLQQTEGHHHHHLRTESMSERESEGAKATRSERVEAADGVNVEASRKTASERVSATESLGEARAVVSRLRERVEAIGDRRSADEAWAKIGEISEWLKARTESKRRETTLKGLVDARGDRPSRDDPDSPPPRADIVQGGLLAPLRTTTTASIEASIAVVMVCFERAELLRKSLGSVVEYHPCGAGPRVVVSQDGGSRREAEVAEVAEAAFRELRRKCASLSSPKTRRTTHSAQTPDGTGYHKLARHFRFALDAGFADSETRFVIVLEEDLVIAPDFFGFFKKAAPLLERDDTLLAASAWNDNGQTSRVRDPARVTRSDFFPGLGWMLTRKLWETELRPKWPAAYWDDWLREPAQRRGRHTLRPEICRTFHLASTTGTSRGQYSAFLADTRLYDGPPVDFVFDHLDDLRAYDQRFFERLSRAAFLPGPDHLAVGGTTTDNNPDVRLEYLGVEDRGPRAFPALARALGVMDNVKAGVPRAAYRGVVDFWRGDLHVFLAPPLDDVRARLFTLDGRVTVLP